MKFRHQSNFIELEVEQVVLTIIRQTGRYETLAKLIACMLTKGDVESVLEEFGYVKIDETVEE